MPEENGDKKKQTSPTIMSPKTVEVIIQPGKGLEDLGIIYTDKVDAVGKGSDAGRLGVQAGMVMQKINGKISSHSEPFEKIIEKANKGNKPTSITFAIKSHVIRVVIPAQYGGGFVTVRAPEGSKSETVIKAAVEKLNKKGKRDSLINPSLFRIQFDEKQSEADMPKASPTIAMRTFSMVRKNSAPLYDDTEGLGLLSNEKITFEPTRLGLRYTKNIVVEICEGSQAEKKGIEKGWTILKINGKIQPEEENAIYEEIKKQMQTKKPFSIIFRTTRFLNTLENALYNQEKTIQETKNSIDKEELEIKKKRIAIEDTLKSLKEQKKKLEDDEMMLEKKKQWFKNQVSIGSTNENKKNSKPCNLMEKQLFKNQLDIANNLKSYKLKKKKQFKNQHTIASPTDAFSEELKKTLRKRNANISNNDLEKNTLTEEKVQTQCNE